MNKKLGIGIAWISVVVLAGIIVAIAINPIVVAKEEEKFVKAKYSVITTEYGIPKLKVTVNSNFHLDLKVILSDPDRNTIDTAYIRDEDLLDGIESVELRMAKYGELPKPGTYKFFVRPYGVPPNNLPGFYFSTEGEVTLTAANVNIEKAEFKTAYHRSSGYSSIDRVILTVTNDGDLPVTFDKLIIRADGIEEEEDLTLSGYPLYRVSRGESEEINRSVSISGLKEETCNVTVELYSLEDKVADYSMQLTFEIPEVTPTPSPTPTAAPAPTPTSSPTPTVPGFEVAFTISSLLTMAHLVLRRRGGI